MQATREEELAVRVAIAAARKAWTAIEPYYGGTFEIHEKEDGPCTTADRLSDKIICQELQAVFPTSEYGYLSEETADSNERLERERVWIIDPIDGTNDFIDKTGQFVIQIGLARLYRGKYRLVGGVVYNAPRGKMYYAMRGCGAYVQDDAGGKPRRLKVSKRKGPKGLRAVVSRSHVSSDLLSLIDSLGPGEKVHMGSVGLKICALVEGQADYYVNIAVDKTKEWDSCGPEMILEEAGGRMSDMRGVPLPYNGKNVKHTYALLATNGACHDNIVEGIKAHFSKPGVDAPKLLLERLGLA